MTNPPGQRRPDYPLTDLGNAHRFADLHRVNVRYCWPWSKWLVWTDRRWGEDSTGEVYRRARAAVANIHLQAAQLHVESTQTEDDTERDKLANQAAAVGKWAKVAEDQRHFGAIATLARSETGLQVLPDQLDRDPWALNCLNGTLDLRTGQLRPHERDDYITKLAPVDYDPTAPCPIWLKFLDRVQPISSPHVPM